jgi:integrase
MLIAGPARAALKADKATPAAEPNNVMLFDALDFYWKEHAKYLPSAERSEIAINHFKSFFGNAMLTELSRKRQQEYVDVRDAGDIAPATIATELSTLRAALRMAREEFGADIPQIFYVDVDATPKRWLTKDEAARLFDACRSWHIRLFMEIALETGSRPSAILDLEWSRVDFQQCRIDFNPPGRKRTAKARPIIPISAALRDRLLAAREQDKKNAKRKKRPLCDYVIAYAGYPVGTIKRAFRATAREAGFYDVTPYVLRHTAATWMAQAGVALWDIATYLGTSLKMVEEHYAHHHPDHMRKAVTTIAKAVASVKAKTEPLALRKGRKSRKEWWARYRD